MITVGTFKTLDKAILERDKAMKKAGFHLNHGKDLVEANNSTKSV